MDGIKPQPKKREQKPTISYSSAPKGASFPPSKPVKPTIPISNVPTKPIRQAPPVNSKSIQKKKSPANMPADVLLSSQAYATELPSPRRETSHLELPPALMNRPQRKEELLPPQAKKGPRKAVIIVIAFLVLIASAGLAMGAVSSMTVDITPKQNDFRLKKPVTFTIPVEKASLAKTIEVTKIVKTKKAVSVPASGKIRIYNNFNTEPQVLITRTRFESPSGKIYRIKDAVTVPGAKKTGDKLEPAFIETIIYADAPGADYNLMNTTKFSIPGFKGTSKFTGFYGESTGKIDGGFIGESGIVTAEEANPAIAEAESNLKAELTKALAESPPQGFTALKHGEMQVTEKIVEPSIGKPAETFIARASGTTGGVLVKTEELNKLLEGILFENFDASKNKIHVTSTDGFRVVSVSNEGEAMVELSGDIRVIWDPDLDSLRSELSETSVGKVTSVFESYESIAAADVNFSPSWWRRIPGKNSRIHLIVREI